MKLPRQKIELSEGQWAIMKVVWKLQPCAAPTVQEALLKSRKWSYSTVRTLMDRMVPQGLLTTEKIRNLTLYRAAITPKQAQRGEVLHTLKHAFNGALTPMVQCLLESHEVTPEQLAELEEFIQKKRREPEFMNTLTETMNTWGIPFAGIALPMLIQSTALIALLLGLDWALRARVRAAVRYALWLLVLVKLALPPSVASPTGPAYWLPAETAGRFSRLVPEEISAGPVKSRMTGMTGMVQKAAFLKESAPELSWQAVLFIVWLAGAAGMGIWVVWRLRVVTGVIRQSAEAPAELRALMESCRRQLGIKRAIPVRCAAIGSPAICGLLRPIVLIPPGLVEDLDEAEMRPVLLHELAHYKRVDLWVNHAQVLLQILHWPNPLVWLANARLRRAREQAVDEMVLVEMGAEAQAYPATLLHVAKLGLGRPVAAMGLMGIVEPGQSLRQRILHIMNRPLPRTARIGVRGLAAVLLLALVALPMACRPKSEPAGQSTANPAKPAGRTAQASDIIRLKDNADPGIHPGGVVHISETNDAVAQAYGILVQDMFDNMATFPEVKDGVPEGGDPKVQGLITWVQSDATNYPGKSFHQLSYIMVIGSEDSLGNGDRAKSYTLHFGSRNVLVNLLARANFASSKSAMVVATYDGGDEPLHRQIALHWDDYQSPTHAPANEWRLRKEAGPDPARIRE